MDGNLSKYKNNIKQHKRNNQTIIVSKVIDAFLFLWQNGCI